MQQTALPSAKHLMNELQQSGVELRVTKHNSGLYTAKTWNSAGGVEPVDRLVQDLRFALSSHNIRLVSKSESIADWRDDQPRIGVLIQFRIVNEKAPAFASA